MPIANCNSSFDNHNQNCQCVTNRGDDIRNFKQFDTETQKYHCCLELDISPPQFKTYIAGGTCTKQYKIREYYDAIKEYKKGSSLTNHGCCYSLTGYGIDDISNEENNRHQLYNNIAVDNSIYNNFFADKSPPAIGASTITCIGTEDTPYILDYRGFNRDSIFDKTLYFCGSSVSPTIFNNIPDINGNQLNYSVSRFYNINGTPYENGLSDLGTRPESVETRRNNSPSFENNKSEYTESFIIAGCVLIFIFPIPLSYFIYNYKIYEREKERNPETSSTVIKISLFLAVSLLISAIVLIVLGLKGGNGPKASQNNPANQFLNTITPKKNNVF